ncbi:unnamed protein product [Closterium sp. NIES-53]
MAITIHFIATSLPDLLAPVHDDLLRKHPIELTIDGCTVPQLPTFTASLASTASPSPLETTAVSTMGGWSRGKGGKRGGKGGGVGGGGGGGGGSGDTSASGGGDSGSGPVPAGPTGGGGGAVMWCSSSLSNGDLVDQGALVVAVVHPARRCVVSFRLLARTWFSQAVKWVTLAKKSDVTSTLIRWLLATETARSRRVSCLHSDRGGKFYSGILRRFCSEQGITQSWMLLESPQQNGVAERRIRLVMEISRTSMIHACAPHFLWPYAVCYASHQLNLWPCISRPGASPTSLWTGSLGVVSEFRVWGCIALVRDTSADKLSARAIPCVFLGFPVDSSDYTFYHPPLHRFLDSGDVRFSESVSYYTQYPCRGVSVPPPPLFLAPSPPPAPAPLVHPPPPSPALSAQQPSALPQQVAVDSGGVGVGSMNAKGASFEGAGAEGVGAGGTSSEGAGAEATGAGGARSGGTRAGVAATGSASSGGARLGDTSSGGARVGGASSEGTRAGGTATVVPTPPPHRYPTSFQTIHQLEREERERLEQERLGLERQQHELQQQEQQRQDSSLSSRPLTVYPCLRCLLLLSRTTRQCAVPLVLVPRLLLTTSALSYFVRVLVILHLLFSCHLLSRLLQPPPLPLSLTTTVPPVLLCREQESNAMILLCREPRLESRVRHIDVRYFLLRELQRRGQARLDFVAPEANTTDIFTKALPPGDHHRFCLQLGLVDVGSWLQ